MLTFYSEELEVEGIVQYSSEENVWVGVIDWNALRESEVMEQDLLVSEPLHVGVER